MRGERERVSEEYDASLSGQSFRSEDDWPLRPALASLVLCARNFAAPLFVKKKILDYRRIIASQCMRTVKPDGMYIDFA